MHAFLSKVFGRKKDEKETSPTTLAPGELLDGKFEAISPNVSPSATKFLELDPKANGHDGKEKDNGGLSLLRAKSRPSSSEVKPKKLDTLPHLSLNFPAPKEDSSTNNLDSFLDPESEILLSDTVIGQRRLNPLEALVLIRACSQAIIARGLETLGIMHPHWYSASPDVQRRLISQFIRSLDLKSPVTALTPASASPFESEMDFTSPHDVAAVLRWGLRHLQLEGDNFGTDDGWYKAFLDAEAAADYPPKAFSEKLSPKLPPAHLQLLTATLEIFSSLAAHSEANSTSGSKLSKIFGLWLLTARRVEEKDDWHSFYTRWERTGRMLEHLFLARIRDESTDQRLPVRLLDLVRKYPYTQGLSSPTTDLQLLPPSRFTTQQFDALFVRIEIELPAERRKPKSKVHPLNLLADAFSTKVEEGEFAELWAKITATSKDGSNPSPLSNIFADETIRFLSIVPDNSATKQEAKSPAFSLLTGSPTSPHKRFFSSGDEKEKSPAATKHTKPATDPAPLTPISALAIGSDWAQFSSSGFLDSSPAIAPLVSTLFDTDLEKTVPPDTTLSRKSSRRKAVPVPRKSVDMSSDNPTQPPSRGTAETAEPEYSAVVKASKLQIVQIDEAFIDFWSDSLLDPLTSNWPTFIICKFKSTLVPQLLYGTVEEGQKQKSLKWLVLEQVFTVKPPPPPPLPTPVDTPIVRPASPAQSTSGKKRFSFWSISRTASSSSVGSQKGKKKEKTPKIGEMGELLEEDTPRPTKTDTITMKSPTFKSKKSLDRKVSDTAAKSEDKATADTKAAEVAKTAAVVAAATTGVVATGALLAAVPEDKPLADEQPVPEQIAASEVSDNPKVAVPAVAPGGTSETEPAPAALADTLQDHSTPKAEANEPAVEPQSANAETSADEAPSAATRDQSNTSGAVEGVEAVADVETKAIPESEISSKAVVVEVKAEEPAATPEVPAEVPQLAESVSALIDEPAVEAVAEAETPSDTVAVPESKVEEPLQDPVEVTESSNAISAPVDDVEVELSSGAVVAHESQEEEFAPAVVPVEVPQAAEPVAAPVFQPAVEAPVPETEVRPSVATLQEPIEAVQPNEGISIPVDEPASGVVAEAESSSDAGVVRGSMAEEHVFALQASNEVPQSLEDISAPAMELLPDEPVITATESTVSTIPAPESTTDVEPGLVAYQAGVDDVVPEETPAAVQAEADVPTVVEQTEVPAAAEEVDELVTIPVTGAQDISRTSTYEEPPAPSVEVELGKTTLAGGDVDETVPMVTSAQWKEVDNPTPQVSQSVDESQGEVSPNTEILESSAIITSLDTTSRSEAAEAEGVDDSIHVVPDPAPVADGVPGASAEGPVAFELAEKSAPAVEDSISSALDESVPEDHIAVVSDPETINVASSVPRIEPISLPQDSSSDKLVDLPAVPLVEAIPLPESEYTHVTIPLTSEQVLPGAGVESFTEDRFAEMTDAPDAASLSGSTPGPQIALSSSHLYHPSQHFIQPEPAKEGQNPTLSEELVESGSAFMVGESTFERAAGNHQEGSISQGQEDVALSDEPVGEQQVNAQILEQGSTSVSNEETAASFEREPIVKDGDPIVDDANVSTPVEEPVDDLVFKEELVEEESSADDKPNLASEHDTFEQVDETISVPDDAVPPVIEGVVSTEKELNMEQWAAEEQENFEAPEGVAVASIEEVPVNEKLEEDISSLSLAEVTTPAEDEVLTEGKANGQLPTEISITAVDIMPVTELAVEESTNVDKTAVPVEEESVVEDIPVVEESGAEVQKDDAAPVKEDLVVEDVSTVGGPSVGASQDNTASIKEGSAMEELPISKEEPFVEELGAEALEDEAAQVVVAPLIEEAALEEEPDGELLEDSNPVKEELVVEDLHVSEEDSVVDEPVVEVLENEEGQVKEEPVLEEAPLVEDLAVEVAEELPAVDDEPIVEEEELVEPVVQQDAVAQEPDTEQAEGNAGPVHDEPIGLPVVLAVPIAEVLDDEAVQVEEEPIDAEKPISEEVIEEEPIFEDVTKALTVDEESALAEEPAEPVARDKPIAGEVVSELPEDNATPVQAPVAEELQEVGLVGTEVKDDEASVPEESDVAAIIEEPIVEQQPAVTDEPVEIVEEEPSAEVLEDKVSFITESSVLESPVIEEPILEAPVAEEDDTTPVIEEPIVEEAPVEPVGDEKQFMDERDAEVQEDVAAPAGKGFVVEEEPNVEEPVAEESSAEVSQADAPPIEEDTVLEEDAVAPNPLVPEESSPSAVRPVAAEGLPVIEVPSADVPGYDTAFVNAESLVEEATISGAQEATTGVMGDLSAEGKGAEAVIKESTVEETSAEVPEEAAKEEPLVEEESAVHEETTLSALEDKGVPQVVEDALKAEPLVEKTSAIEEENPEVSEEDAAPMKEDVEGVDSANENVATIEELRPEVPEGAAALAREEPAIEEAADVAISAPEETTIASVEEEPIEEVSVVEELSPDDVEDGGLVEDMHLVDEGTTGDGAGDFALDDDPKADDAQAETTAVTEAISSFKEEPVVSEDVAGVEGTNSELVEVHASPAHDFGPSEDQGVEDEAEDISQPVVDEDTAISEEVISSAPSLEPEYHIKAEVGVEDSKVAVLEEDISGPSFEESISMEEQTGDEDFRLASEESTVDNPPTSDELAPVVVDDAPVENLIAAGTNVSVPDEYSTHELGAPESKVAEEAGASTGPTPVIAVEEIVPSEGSDPQAQASVVEESLLTPQIPVKEDDSAVPVVEEPNAAAVIEESVLLSTVSVPPTASVPTEEPNEKALSGEEHIIHKASASEQPLSIEAEHIPEEASTAEDQATDVILAAEEHLPEESPCAEEPSKVVEEPVLLAETPEGEVAGVQSSVIQGPIETDDIVQKSSIAPNDEATTSDEPPAEEPGAIGHDPIAPSALIVQGDSFVQEDVSAADPSATSVEAMPLEAADVHLPTPEEQPQPSSSVQGTPASDLPAPSIEDSIPSQDQVAEEYTSVVEEPTLPPTVLIQEALPASVEAPIHSDEPIPEARNPDVEEATSAANQEPVAEAPGIEQSASFFDIPAQEQALAKDHSILSAEELTRSEELLTGESIPGSIVQEAPAAILPPAPSDETISSDKTDAEVKQVDILDATAFQKPVSVTEELVVEQPIHASAVEPTSLTEDTPETNIVEEMPTSVTESVSPPEVSSVEVAVAPAETSTEEPIPSTEDPATEEEGILAEAEPMEVTHTGKVQDVIDTEVPSESTTEPSVASEPVSVESAISSIGEAEAEDPNLEIDSQITAIEAEILNGNGHQANSDTKAPDVTWDASAPVSEPVEVEGPASTSNGHDEESSLIEEAKDIAPLETETTSVMGNGRDSKTDFDVAAPGTEVEAIATAAADSEAALPAPGQT